MRHEFLYQSATVSVLTQNGTREQIIRNIMRYEEIRHDFQRINWYIQRHKKREKTTHIEIPTEDGWTKITDPDAIMILLTN